MQAIARTGIISVSNRECWISAFEEATKSGRLLELVDKIQALGNTALEIKSFAEQHQVPESLSFRLRASGVCTRLLTKVGLVVYAALKTTAVISASILWRVATQLVRSRTDRALIRRCSRASPGATLP